MRKVALYVLFVSLSVVTLNAQVVFENGYFINDSNERVECLIRNVDWRSNPTTFDYKLTEDGPVERGNPETVKEFGVNGGKRYVSADVQIDRSSDQLSKMTEERNPAFEEEKLFLQILIQGNGSLYQYVDGGLIRFFYSLPGSEITQLVYKKYLTNAHNVAANNQFRQQLLNEFKCAGISKNDLDDLDYAARAMKEFFIKYNECIKSDYAIHDSPRKLGKIHVSVRPGISIASLLMNNSKTNSTDMDFGSKQIFRLGVEAEYILPFNKNKWGVIIEPTYKPFKIEAQRPSPDVSGGVLAAAVEYSSIELPIGLRHYFFLTEGSKIFVNFSILVDIPMNNPHIEQTRADGSLINRFPIKPETNFVAGVGYKFKNRLGVELRIHRKREIMSGYGFWNTEYTTSSLIFGYTIF